MAASVWDEDVPYERLEAMEGASSVGEAMGAALDAMGAGTRERIEASRQAARAWAEANGDRERAHTTGVALAEPRRGASDPRLLVYVDSSVLLSDFRTNCNLYLGRLAMWGLALSGIDFRLSRDPERRWHAEHQTAPDAPPLSADDAAELDSLVEHLPEGLREKVRSAAEASLRRA